MADQEETGGIVTTVKKESTSDLDVVKFLKDQATDEPAEGDIKPEEPAATEEKFDYKKLTPAQRKEFDAQAAERRRLKKEVERLAAEKPANDGKQPAPAAARDEKPLVRPTRPDPVKFKTQAEYDAADAKYEDELFDYKTAVRQRDEVVQRQQAADRALLDNFQEQKDKFIEAGGTAEGIDELKRISGLDEPPSFEDATDNDNPMSDIMFGAVIEEGPALLYYLATHRQEAAKIYKMNQRDQVKAIMRIVVKKLERDDEQKPAAREPEKPRTPAKPIEPVSGRGGTPAAKPRAQLSFKEKEAAAAKAGKLNYVP